jgi:hypothetical protein
MALSSQQILEQIQGMGKMPDYKTEITKAYDAPVLKPLVQEGANLEAQYLPSLFDPFTKMGTGAADMSAAAKLSGLGGSVNRLTSRIGANNAMQNYYGAQIGDLAGKMSGDWKDQIANLWQMYQAQSQQEEAARQAAAMSSWGMGGGGGGGMGGGGEDDFMIDTGEDQPQQQNSLTGLARESGNAITDLFQRLPAANVASQISTLRNKAQKAAIGEATLTPMEALQLKSSWSTFGLGSAYERRLKERGYL